MKGAIEAEALRLHVRPADVVRHSLSRTLDETKSVATAIKALTGGTGDTDRTLAELRQVLMGIKSRGERR